MLGYLPSNNVENVPLKPATDDPQRLAEALNSLVPLDPSKPYSMHSVIESWWIRARSSSCRPGLPAIRLWVWRGLMG